MEVSSFNGVPVLDTSMDDDVMLLVDMVVFVLWLRLFFRFLERGIGNIYIIEAYVFPEVRDAMYNSLSGHRGKTST